MNPRERLQYALYLRRLQDLFVIKENIAFEYQHKNFNKAAAQIDKVVDQCLNDNILNTVEGTVSLKNPKVDHVITEALTSQQKMLVKRPDKFMDKAVRDNTKQFSNFLQNRIEKENYSLQNKINEEYKKKKYSKMPEAEAKKILTEKFQDHARKRAKNIVRDALHTNQSHMSWINGIQGDYKYKVWMNGQGKGRVRPWHREKLIDPVEIDDYFDIYGSSHVQMMYPGDLEGGAENVANCRCWLHYTNIAPSNLKPRGTVQVNPNVSFENENRKTFSANTESKGRSRKPRSSESTSTSKKEGLFTKIRGKIPNIRNVFPPKKGKKKHEMSKKSRLTKLIQSLFLLNPNIPIKSQNKKIKLKKDNTKYVEHSQHQADKVCDNYVLIQGFYSNEFYKRIIDKWSTKFFRELNEYIRGKSVPPSMRRKDLERYRRILSSLIDSTSGLIKPTKLFRGEKDVDLSRFVVGEVNTFEGFIGSSFYRGVGKKFKGDRKNQNDFLIIMHAKTGTKGIAINGKQLGEFRNQYEWLLNDGQKYVTRKVDVENGIIEIDLL